MKRQHPTDLNLFWCPKCPGYKTRGEFYYSKDTKHNIAERCKECAKISNNNWRLKYSYRLREQDRIRASTWRKENPTKAKQTANKYHHKKEILDKGYRKNLSNNYVSHCMRVSIPNPTPEIIELKRQQIIMKRTLKQFKQWRGKHERAVERIS